MGSSSRSAHACVVVVRPVVLYQSESWTVVVGPVPSDAVHVLSPVSLFCCGDPVFFVPLGVPVGRVLLGGL